MQYETEMKFRKWCNSGRRGLDNNIRQFIEGVYLGFYYTCTNGGKAYGRGYAVGDWIARNSKGIFS
jgi:hypothetical protein